MADKIRVAVCVIFLENFVVTLREISSRRCLIVFTLLYTTISQISGKQHK